MIYQIEAFCHIGTKRKINQDAMLIQGEVFRDNKCSKTSKNPVCFVADGVGGGPAGEFASSFVLEKIAGLFHENLFGDRNQCAKLFHGINDELFRYGNDNPEYEGMATTLSGILICDNRFITINAGDSQVWILSGEKLKKLTHDHVVSKLEINSPITSFFGGYEKSLDIEISSVTEKIVNGDIFVLATDGIFKIFFTEHLERILLSSKTLKEKSDFILFKSLNIGSPDNISCILIEAMQGKS